MLKLILASVIMAILTVTGCYQKSADIDYGIQPQHSSFVPARIAILKCRLWPNGARYNDLPMTNFNEEDLQQLCKNYDEFVIKGFENQPYMRGISPKAVERTLISEKGENFIGAIDNIWQHKKDDCHRCDNSPSFYSQAIANRITWRTWLVELSRITKNSDALLIPFVTYGFERSFDDRGLLVTQRVAGISLLLIDTNNGYLLWAGGRDAQASNQSLNPSPNGANPSPPPPKWSDLFDRLFTEEVWREFPGRQVYH